MGLGDCICCRLVAPIEIPALQQRRHLVLKACMNLCGLSILFAILGFTGAYVQSEGLLSTFPWLVVKGPKTSYYAGVKHVCSSDHFSMGFGSAWKKAVKRDPESRGTWQCRPWKELDCDRITKYESECELCQEESTGIATAVAIGVVTYLAFANKTHARLIGKDSNCTKFMACFSALIGGTNFLLATLSYRKSCVLAVIPEPGVDTLAGLGFTLTLVATVLKVFMGLMHLGLPVDTSVAEKKGEESENGSSSEDDEESESENGNAA